MAFELKHQLYGIHLFAVSISIASVLQGCEVSSSFNEDLQQDAESQPSCDVQLSHVLASVGVYDKPIAPIVRKVLISDDWRAVKRYASNGTLNNDAADLWIKAGECILAFRGSDDITDFSHDIDLRSKSFYGLQNVAVGIIKELEPLLELLLADKDTVRSSCPNSFVVTGHSLGGGLAQLFAVLVNKRDDPLNWGSRKVDAVYTHGSLPISKERLTNDQRSDGCFKGKSYYTAHVDDIDGPIYADFAIFVGPTGFKHVKREQVFVHKSGSIKFACVEEVSRDKLKRVNIFKWQKMHKLALYVNSVHREATSSEKEVEATSSDEDAWPAGVKPSSLSCTR